ncbi:MAG: ribonuclease III [Rhodospirillaceae bacterium]|jgi:ribonuclease III|nr:ribonuclease III [Rhodospirillaceae bacterium]MBT5944160.1 ribonuclease III [Rhodospirillaceae bacterium]MBT6404424.1 ribonuclease III [Rhodospirillaceae bacterium]MBT6536405.1 ribonuclease III [Rhodospirillaceae bacterium]MBT7362475.1 ribonuclease III [Rhodospirillaceae bacterium]
MVVASDLGALERTLGHVFANRALLERALTHASLDPVHSYERLEFLGDRVLGLIVAQMLLDRFPDEDEGEIGRRFSALVNAGSLSQVGAELGLVHHILAGPGVTNEAIIADVVEALIAAMYRDGGFAVADEFIRRIWSPLIETAARPPRDPKTALQEWAQAGARGLPSYHELGRDGPDHAPSFTVEVRIEGVEPVQATGPSKRAAERDAAAIMLQMLGIDHDD